MSETVNNSGNHWKEEGVVRKNSLLRVKLTPTDNSGNALTAQGYYEFNCKSKTIPSCSQAPVWSDVTDNPDEVTGYAYAGKPERLDTIVIVARTPLQIVYMELLEHLRKGTIFMLTYTYDDPHEASVYTITLNRCQIVGVECSGGGNDTGSETTIRVLPEGGTSANMPTVAAAARQSS